MPNGRFYIRNHFQIPNLNAAHYRLAMDRAGRVQPEHSEWNRLGYGNNSIQEVVIRVV
jgi:hypothetical protein